MFDQLEIIENRYEQLNELLSDPDVVSDPNKLREYSKEQSDLQMSLTFIVFIKVTKKRLKNLKKC